MIVFVVVDVVIVIVVVDALALVVAIVIVFRPLAVGPLDLDDTLRWRELYPPTPCELMIASNLDADLGAWKMGPAGPYPRPLSVHTYDLNAFAPDHSVNGILGGGVANDTFYAFDPRTATWTAHPILGGAPGDQAFHAIAYDPANNVFIFRAEYDSGQHTWAYRLRAEP